MVTPEGDDLGGLAELGQDDLLDELLGVGEGLLGGEVLQVLGGEVIEGLRGAVEAVLELVHGGAVLLRVDHRRGGSREPDGRGGALATEQQEDGAALSMEGLVVLVVLLPEHGRLLVVVVVERLHEDRLGGRGAGEQAVQVSAAGQKRAVQPGVVGSVADDVGRGGESER